MSISTEIADFITKATIDDFSTEYIETAKIAILDCMACLIAGSTEPIAQLLCDQAKHNGGNPHSSVFTKNFKTSSQEALKVSKMLKKKGIQSKVLTWRGKVPKKNIQNNARNMRYLLMSNYCEKNNIKYLITAHHLDDQIVNIRF